MPRGSLTFEFDSRKLVNGLTSKAAREAITEMAIPIIERSWRRVAKRKLSPRRAATYINAIQVAAVQGTRVSLVLEGADANIIEYGNDRWDMKPGLLMSDAAKESEDGEIYLRVPMQHSSYRAAGATAAPMGAPYRRKLGADAAFELGKQIYERASKLGPKQELRGTGTPKLRERHKLPIYEGLRRERARPKIDPATAPTDRAALLRHMMDLQKKSRGIASVQYKTYRTVSTASPASSWVYPKRAGAKLIDEALKDATPEIQKGISKLVDGMLVKMKMTKVGK